MSQGKQGVQGTGQTMSGCPTGVSPGAGYCQEADAPFLPSASLREEPQESVTDRLKATGT